MQDADDFCRVIHRKRGLRGEGKRRALGRCHAARIRRILHQSHRTFGQLAHGADHFRVAGMANQEKMAAMFMMVFGFTMHLAHQRAGRVECEHHALRGFGRDRFRHAMGGKHHGLAVIRDFAQLLHKDRALFFKAFHHEAVMDDFMAHIDRGAVAFQRFLHNLDGAVHAGAKASRASEQKVQGRLGRGHGRGVHPRGPATGCGAT